MRFAVLSPIVLALAGCVGGVVFPVPGGSGVTPDDYPVRKASCVDAVRRETRSVDVRAETAEVVGGDTPETSFVLFGLAVGPEATAWTCTADNAGAVSGVAAVPVPAEAGAQGPDEAPAEEG